MTRVACAAFALAAACSPGFEDPAIVEDLRILGASAAPPEVIYAASAPWTVPPDVPRAFDITLLLADPEHRQLTCTLVTCVPNRNRRCEDPETTTFLAEGPCADGETTFHVEVPYEAIAAAQSRDPFYVACAQASAANPDADCYSGLAVFVQFRVTGGERDLYALKSLVFSPELPPGRTPNSNPEISGVRVDEGPVLTPEDGMVRFAFDPGKELRLEVVRTAASKQSYALPTFDGGVRELVEYMEVFYYADAGSFSHHSRTDRPSNPFAAAPDDSTPDMWSRWTAPPAPGGPVRFWFVLTDGRGGEAFLRAMGMPR